MRCSVPRHQWLSYKISSNFSKMRYSKKILSSDCSAVVKKTDIWLITRFNEHIMVTGIPGLIQQLEVQSAPMSLSKEWALKTIKSNNRVEVWKVLEEIWPLRILGVMHLKLCMPRSDACFHSRHGGMEILWCGDLTFRLIIYGSPQGVPDRQACGIDRFTYMLVYCPAFEVSDSGSYSCWGLFLWCQIALSVGARAPFLKDHFFF